MMSAARAEKAVDGIFSNAVSGLRDSREPLVDLPSRKG